MAKKVVGGVPDLVGNFDFDSVGPYWGDGDRAGNFFANKYVASRGDPQCAAVDASIGLMM